MPPTPAPLVSLVVPAYLATPHQAALLDETLETVAAQEVRDHEVIVVDDGSPLDVGAHVARHAGALPALRTLRRPNGGSAQARNTGIADARGTFLVFLDADDHLLPGALAAGLTRLEAEPEAGFVISPRTEMTFEGGPVPWGVPSAPVTDDLYRTLLGFDWHILPPSTAMFRREVVEEVGGFRDPWGADDLDFYLRVAFTFHGVAQDGPAVTRYRRYSTSTSRDGERMLRSIRTVYARQWPLVQDDPERIAAWHTGLARLTPIFRDCLAENVRDRLRARQFGRALRSAALLVREDPWRVVRDLLPTARQRPAGEGRLTQA